MNSEEQILTHTLKNIWLPMETGWGGNRLGVWHGNARKLGNDDHSTTINMIKFLDI